MRRIGGSHELGPDDALAFEAFVRGEERPCFAVRTPGGLRAYLNVCAHRNQPVVVDDRPFDEARLVECRAHGAKYDPETGLCVEGPCEGARLVALAVHEMHGDLLVDEDEAVDDSVYEAG